MRRTKRKESKRKESKKKEKNDDLESAMILYNPTNGRNILDLFEVTMDSSRITTNKLKSFFKGIITRVPDLVRLIQDFSNLVDELYQDEKYNEKLSFNDITVFYVWLFLPYPEKQIENQINQVDIFPYSFYYMRKKLSTFEIKNIITIIKKNNKLSIHTRKYSEEISLPFVITRKTMG